MRLLLDFIYTGGTAVPEERLESFLKAAETLKVTVLLDKGLHTHWKQCEDKQRPVPCLVPIRPQQLGIITPSPWAGAVKPPVGPPRRPLHSPLQVRVSSFHHLHLFIYLFIYFFFAKDFQ
ncbi:hypothetical protein O3M35_003560 [Rhynocoris fuscipes]|uniref:BTB domain-containing protein n=1 Tax=Rhynocoris fuscipes TaxID=488301 RepID=A0AAW1CNG3_9HEMI